MDYFSGSQPDKYSARRAAVVLAIFFQAAGIVCLVLFFKVGHLAERNFKILCALEWLAAGGIVFFKPNLRYFLAAAAAVTLPRIFSIILGHDSHNLLFPFFSGMAAGLTARAGYEFIFRSDMRRASQIPERFFFPAILCVFFLFLAVRAYLDFFAPFRTGALFQDRDLGAGVSANYAFYLCLLATLHCTGPLVFLCVDRSMNFAAKESSGPAESFIRGICFGSVFAFIALLMEEAGVRRLYAGSALSQSAGRLPGLFSDSGAATLFIPFMIFSSLYCLFFIQKYLPPVVREKRGVYYFSAFLLTALLGIHQGRGYYLTVIGIIFTILIVYITKLPLLPPRRPEKLDKMHFKGFLIRAIITAALPALAAVLYITVQHIPSLARLMNEGSRIIEFVSMGNADRALRSLDTPRVELFLAGWKIFLDHPFIGSGLNSFMVFTAPLRVSRPLLPADNPATFFSGLLSDTGILGLLFFSCITAYMLYTYFSGDRKNNAANFLGMFLLALFFPLLYGYHLVHSEFAALTLLPLLMMENREPRGLRAAQISVGVLAASYAGLYFILN